MKSRNLFVALVFLAGCGSDPVWKHPTKDPYEAKEDEADCQRFFGGTDRDFENCMKQKGWRREK